MMYVTLDEAKGQVSIELENPIHDDRLTRLVNAAETWAREFLNVSTLSTFSVQSPPDSPTSIEEDIRSGILLHVEAHFDKDPQSMGILLEAAEKLLWPHRTGLGV